MKTDAVSAIIAYESGELDEQETIELFQGLVDNGMAWSLQGHYGRTAMSLIEAGLVNPTHRNPTGGKMTLTPEEIRETIQRTASEDGGKGRMFEVTFRRRTDKKVNGEIVARAGDIRVIRGRLGMKYGIEHNDDGGKTLVRINGKGQPYEAKAYNLMTVREANGSFRNIPLDSVVSLRVPDTSKHLVGVAI